MPTEERKDLIKRLRDETGFGLSDCGEAMRICGSYIEAKRLLTLPSPSDLEIKYYILKMKGLIK